MSFRLTPSRPPILRRLSREEAEATAIAGLAFLAGDAERLSRFLALSGLDVVNLRTAAQDEGFLAGLMAFIASDESLLLEFASVSGRPPEEIASANLALNPEMEG